MLLLDIGNTAAKWRWYDGETRHQGEAVHGRNWSTLVAALALPLQGAARIEVASVAGVSADTDIQQKLGEVTSVTPVFYYSPAADAGVRNAYQQPARLGVDRWLAIVESWHRCGASIIVDCGSALTIDLVDQEGQHHGGYIVPGLGMMVNSLQQGTGSVRVDETLPPSLAPGCSTAAGVMHGALRMTCAFIDDAVVALRERVHDTCPIFLTGGDARMVLPFLRQQGELAPDLVLDGLERVVAWRDRRE